MGTKMLTHFMVTRCRGDQAPSVSWALFMVLSASAALGLSACESIPLLAPSGSSITLTSSATALPVNGSTDLVAQVLEQAGTPPHSGTRITFTTTLGTIEPAQA